MGEIHALFAVSFPIALTEVLTEENKPATPEMMRDFFEEALQSGFELPLPVFVTNKTLVDLDSFIEERKLPTDLEEVALCDICGEPDYSGPQEDGHILPPDWNGETGNHVSCEQEQDRLKSYGS